MKSRFLFIFACIGFFAAIVLAAIRLYLLAHRPHYPGWFDQLSVIVWPGAFYLFVLQAAEPTKVVVFVYSVAIASNVAIYTLIGLLVQSVTRRLQRRNER